MNVYAIGGLGADQRVFQKLELKSKLTFIDWISPKKNEQLNNYANRLVDKYEIKSPFSIIGVSFGGLVAVEISKIVQPVKLILVSSIETKSQLRIIFRLIACVKVLNILPRRMFLPPYFVADFLFSAKNKSLLHEILADTDLGFVKWALIQLTGWRNTIKLKDSLLITGTNDRLLPVHSKSNTIYIKNGGHFMIVDKAKEISIVINNYLNLA